MLYIVARCRDKKQRLHFYLHQSAQLLSGKHGHHFTDLEQGIPYRAQGQKYPVSHLVTIMKLLEKI